MQDTSLKAGYLINFLEFVQWNQDPGPVLQIGIIGAPDIADRIDSIASKGMSLARHKTIQVQQVDAESDLSDLDLVFLSELKAEQIPDYIKALSQQQVLLVSDASNFLEQGGMIEFVMAQNRLRFSLSQTNSQKAGLRFSSKLLDLAVEIQ